MFVVFHVLRFLQSAIANIEFTGVGPLDKWSLRRTTMK